jgi:hypothetical protein
MILTGQGMLFSVGVGLVLWAMLIEGVWLLL